MVCQRLRCCAVLLAVVFASGCGATAKLTIPQTTGPQPVLPAPSTSLLPTVNVVDAEGWPEGATPVAKTGARVVAFAKNLDHPRWIHVLPNGDVLVAETNAPPRPDDGKGIKASTRHSAWRW
jgi:glucose/arabinose dehydrogenase